MTGWRCGFVAGNELLVKAYGDVKDNTDSGQFLAIQHAAALRLRSPGDHRRRSPPSIRRRMDALVAVLDQAPASAPASRRARSSSTSKRPKAAVSKDGTRIDVRDRRGRLASG